MAPGLSLLHGCIVLGIVLLSTAGTAFAQEVQAENVTVVEGGTAEISCRLHQYDGSIVVIQNPSRQTLFFNGTRALKDERFQLVEFTPKQVKIHLSNAKLEDEGGYFCQLYTEDTHHQIATLTVLVPPENPVVEVKEQAVEGGLVELICSAPRTKPEATLRWYRDRRELKGVTSKQENIKTFSITNSVQISVERRDNGEIVTCEASHPALRGQKKQTQYVLDVQYPSSAASTMTREPSTSIQLCPWQALSVTPVLCRMELPLVMPQQPWWPQL
ncbi:cell adhesion molecule 4-like [Engystomops pustulosus]|uniref:cell adhesion molecule 4-like n=1 Tax=Engystomops pustulosus TaxID=76066 RepID=UPI003AFA229E